MLGPAEVAERREAISYAVLTLMERLSPNERAVYVLREAFDHPHRDIAEILGISEAASQQFLHRAKKHVAYAEAGPAIDKAAAQRIVEEFLGAASTGRTDELVRLLTKEAIAVGDGGGKVPARTKAFEGAVAVARFVRGMVRPTEAKRAIVGGSPEIYAWTANGEPAAVVVVEGRVVASCAWRSPPRASLPAVRRQTPTSSNARPTNGRRPTTGVPCL
jgi:RNA polymerase sigma-70 factor (ECF subfamily)